MALCLCLVGDFPHFGLEFIDLCATRSDGAKHLFRILEDPEIPFKIIQGLGGCERDCGHVAVEGFGADLVGFSFAEAYFSAECINAATVKSVLENVIWHLWFMEAEMLNVRVVIDDF